MQNEAEVLTELLGAVGFIDDEIAFIDEICDIEEEEKTKVLEFYVSDSSDNFAIFSFKHREKKIFQLFDMITKDSTFSYIRDDKMCNSHLLNIINRRRSNANKKRNL